MALRVLDLLRACQENGQYVPVLVHDPGAAVPYKSVVAVSQGPEGNAMILEVLNAEASDGTERA